MILRSLVSRGFLRPSHHYIPCRKHELLLDAPWGRVQVWREYSGAPQGQPRVRFLRFLGSRGRAEMATLDPADRLEGDAEVWTVNPPGFGATTGPSDLEHYADCALMAAAALREHSKGQPVWAYGKSIGTTAALLAAADGLVHGVILRNAMPLRELLERRYAWRTLGLSTLLAKRTIPSRLDSLANAGRARVPALFLVSREDRVVPPPFQREVIAAYGGPATVLEVQGGHDERVLRPADEAAYRERLRRLVVAS